ncbi:MAG: hypothetical protein NWE78_08685, partial [Candidatus Bathyarchaeota archaeon]|nr:hypothetical protein [Candidatus Bathyarchaeota archaeon]
MSAIGIDCSNKPGDRELHKTISKILIFSVALLVLPLLASYASPAIDTEDSLQEWFTSNGYSINATRDET